jgi:hypothetical protein
MELKKKINHKKDKKKHIAIKKIKTKLDTKKQIIKHLYILVRKREKKKEKKNSR